VLLGDLCASNVTTGDIKDPCIVDVDGIVGSNVKVIGDLDCDVPGDASNDNCEEFN
jgi:hypothetical protein